jgi:hypothetical protein
MTPDTVDTVDAGESLGPQFWTEGEPADVPDFDLPPLSGPQLAILEATERCVDAEGAIRSGKSTAAGLKFWLRALTEPGINLLASRWKDQDLNGQLRALWRQVGAWFPVQLHPRWDAQEECYVFPERHGKTSRVYMRSLKSAEDTGRYSKFRGLTLAGVWLEQAEEVPHDVYVELKGRLSQPGYYKQMLLTPNPVDDDHWIADEFPEDGDKPGHRYITSDVYSNRDVLGDEVIEGFESDFPEGHPKRRTLIHGLRGVNVIGKPVYDGYFELASVSDRVAFNPAFDLLEGWDFGHAYPAVVWEQYNPAQDRLQLVGAVQGRDMFLEDFAPEVLEIRGEWFPHALVRSYGDPSGDTGNQGTKVTAMSTLRELDIPVRPADSANDPAVRDRAIQTTSALMWRKRFKVNPRCLELSRVNGRIERRQTKLVVSALSVGYVWDERKALRTNPNIRSPRKNTRYDHTMNCHEYIVTGEKLPAKPRAEDLQRAAKQHTPAIVRVARAAQRADLAELRRAQRNDVEPDERPVRSRRRARGGSY